MRITRSRRIVGRRRPGVVIEARELSKRYGATLAVDDLSFTVAAGQVTGFLGPNGSGKSTTMRMIMGLDAPSAGRITVGGRSYRELRFLCTRSARCWMRAPRIRVAARAIT